MMERIPKQCPHPRSKVKVLETHQTLWSLPIGREAELLPSTWDELKNGIDTRNLQKHIHSIWHKLRNFFPTDKHKHYKQYYLNYPDSLHSTYSMTNQHVCIVTCSPLKWSEGKIITTHEQSKHMDKISKHWRLSEAVLAGAMHNTITCFCSVSLMSLTTWSVSISQLDRVIVASFITADHLSNNSSASFLCGFNDSFIALESSFRDINLWLEPGTYNT